MRTSLDITSVFKRALVLYRDNAGLLLISALVVFLLPEVVFGLVFAETVTPIAAVLALSLLIVGGFWYQGLAVLLAGAGLYSRSEVGWWTVLRSSLSQLGPVSTVGTVVFLAVLLGFVLLVVPGILFVTWWALAIPVVVMEQTGVIASLRRSRRLVRGTGNGFEVFAVLAAGIVVGLAIRNIPTGTVGAVDPGGGWVWFVGSLFGTLVPPVSALAAALMYFDLRAIHERQHGAAAAPGSAWSPAPECAPSAETTSDVANLPGQAERR